MSRSEIVTGVKAINADHHLTFNSETAQLAVGLVERNALQHKVAIVGFLLDDRRIVPIVDHY
jgi:hypothetical protein